MHIFILTYLHAYCTCILTHHIICSTYLFNFRPASSLGQLLLWGLKGHICLRVQLPFAVKGAPGGRTIFLCRGLQWTPGAASSVMAEGVWMYGQSAVTSPLQVSARSVQLVCMVGPRRDEARWPRGAAAVDRATLRPPQRYFFCAVVRRRKWKEVAAKQCTRDHGRVDRHCASNGEAVWKMTLRLATFPDQY